jgi:4'-phosphopantetheinyl transferase EntD
MTRIEVQLLEQSEADVSASNHWLSANELLFVDGFRFEKRRADWRQGRWTAKLALACHFSIPIEIESLANIEIRPAKSGAPEAFIFGKPAAATISLSHRAGRAICVVAAPGVKLGCDVEAVEEHSAAFLADYFTRTEQYLISNRAKGEQSLATALLWSAKESALKALHEGLRLDTRAVSVSIEHGQLGDSLEWRPFQVHYEQNTIFHGWWLRQADLVRTVAADPAPNAPLLLTQLFAAK